MRKLPLSIALFLLTGFASGLAAQPAPMVVKRLAGVTRTGASVYTPVFIPLRLLTAPYASLTLAEQQAVPAEVYGGFWSFVNAAVARNEPASCLPPSDPTLADTPLRSAPSQSIGLLDLASSMPVVVIGDRIYQEPVWNVSDERVATLSYLKITQIAKNESGQPLAVNDVVAFLGEYGSVQVAGKTFCSLARPAANDLPAPGGIAVGETKEFVLVGYLSPVQNRFLLTHMDYVYRVVAGEIYPPPGISSLKDEAVTVTKLLNTFQQ